MIIFAKKLIVAISLLLFSIINYASSGIIKSGEVINAKLSPSGKYLAVVSGKGDRNKDYIYKRQLTVYDTATLKKVYSDKSRKRVNTAFFQIHWHNDELLAFTNIIGFPGAKRAELNLLEIQNGKIAQIYGKVRERSGDIIPIFISGLGPYTKGSEVLFPVIANNLASDNNSLLVSFADLTQPDARPQVKHINLDTKAHRLITELPKQDLVLFSDEYNQPALATNGMQSFWFDPDQNRWQKIKLSINHPNDIYSVTRDHSLITYSMDGQNSQPQLVQFDISSKQESIVDLGAASAHVVLTKKDGSAIAVQYLSRGVANQIELVGNTMKDNQAVIDQLNKLQQMTSGKRFIINSYSDEFEKLVVSVEDDKDNSTIYLYDPESAQLALLGPVK